MKRLVVSAEARVRQVYTCHTCGKQALGDTVTGEFHGDRIPEVPLRAYHMPMFWASYGTHFKCPA